MPRSHVHTERVRFGDLDAMRHLNNVVFLRYFETARIAFMRDLFPTHDPAHPEATRSGLIFAECHINYRSPVHFDEEVAIECSVGEIRRSAFQVRFTMAVEGRLAADGYGWLVGFDYEAQRSSPLPEPLRDALVAAAA
ncbi:MAG TPA: thioesterase family protein [Thermoleophilaceae bacterium]|nr:thioesterase family protein [Thermoleophilaceae bacterium]